MAFVMGWVGPNVDQPVGPAIVGRAKFYQARPDGRAGRVFR